MERLERATLLCERSGQIPFMVSSVEPFKRVPSYLGYRGRLETLGGLDELMYSLRQALDV